MFTPSQLKTDVEINKTTVAKSETIKSFKRRRVVKRLRPTIHTERMLGFAQDMCARHPALCFYIPYAVGKQGVGFGNFELTRSRGQYAERHAATHCISQLTQSRLFIKKRRIG